MKTLITAVIGMTVLLLMYSFASAGGDTQKGKALFNDAKFAGGTTGKSCNSCHPEGYGLNDTGSKKVWRMMGKKFNSIEEVINYHIDKALHGKVIDPKSADMEDIVAYIKTFK